MLLLSLACTAPTTTRPPSRPTAETSDTSASIAPTGDTAALPAPWSAGDCLVDPTSGVPIAARELFRNTSDTHYDLYSNDALMLPLGPDRRVFASADDWRTWLDATGLPVAPDALDFASEIVVVGTYHASASCGVQLGTLSASEVDDRPHVVMSLLDTSYLCPFPCSAEQDIVWIVAVPRTQVGTATACVSVGGGCGALP